MFKDKRELSGKIGYFVKYCRKNISKDEGLINFVVSSIDFSSLDTKNEQMLKQVFEQTSKLYINTNTNSNAIMIEFFMVFGFNWLLLF